VGDFAARRASEVLKDQSVRTARILHPSPACPAANADWDGQATATLEKIGAWAPSPPKRPITRPLPRPRRSPVAVGSRRP
jgi:hypothetical protein